jgi:hypothetical protein
VTVAERLQEAEERIQRLEDDNARLLDLARGLVVTVEQLARLAGAHVPTVAEPARPALRLVQGGRP